MLTSYHYLLGSFVAVSCLTSAFLKLPSEYTSSHPPAVEIIEVAYRGSGRFNSTTGRSERDAKAISQSTESQLANQRTEASADLNTDLSTDVSVTATTTNNDDPLFLSHRGSGRIVPDPMTTRL